MIAFLLVIGSHYAFDAPPEKARLLVAESDDVYAHVAAIFGGDVQELIEVRFGGTAKWAAGEAYGKSIEMDLDAPLAELMQTLAHETTHSFITLLSDGRLETHQSEARFFHEGLARWVELETFGTKRARAQELFEAAVLFGRGDADFPKLCDGDTFRRDHGEDGFYSLGLVFFDAFVELYGKKSIGKLVRSLGAQLETWNLNGPPLWERAFAAAGFDLNAVLARYGRRLADAFATHKNAIAAIPRVAATVGRSDDTYYVALDDALPPDVGLVCRFRSDATKHWEYGETRGDRTCVVPAALLADRFDYQLWLIDDVRGYELSSPWVSASRSAALALDLRAIDVMLEQICNVGRGGACYSLAAAAEFDRLPERALELYAKGCAAKHSRSCVQLGDLQASKRRLRQARAAYAKACAQGSADGCFELGVCEYEGTCAERNHAEAGQHFRRACDRGNAAGCGFLGALYKDGDTVEKDDARAAALFRRACDDGNGDACRRLAALTSDKAHQFRLYGAACRLDADACAEYAVYRCKSGRKAWCTR